MHDIKIALLTKNIGLMLTFSSMYISNLQLDWLLATAYNIQIFIVVIYYWIDFYLQLYVWRLLVRPAWSGWAQVTSRRRMKKCSTTQQSFPSKVIPLNPCPLQLPPSALPPQTSPLNIVPSTPNLQPCHLNPSLSTPTSQPQPLNPNLNLIVLLFAIILPFTKKQAILLHGASIYKLWSCDPKSIRTHYM